jgi:hypothetical protein
LLDVHRIAALAIPEEISKTAELSIRQRFILAQGSHAPPLTAIGLQYYRSCLSPLKLDGSPEYRLCGRSLCTAMLNAFFCPITTTNFLPRVIPV